MTTRCQGSFFASFLFYLVLCELAFDEFTTSGGLAPLSQREGGDKRQTRVGGGCIIVWQVGEDAVDTVSHRGRGQWNCDLIFIFSYKLQLAGG